MRLSFQFRCVVFIPWESKCLVLMKNKEVSDESFGFLSKAQIEKLRVPGLAVFHCK